LLSIFPFYLYFVSCFISFYEIKMFC
jgi:hypothetical protein